MAKNVSGKLNTVLIGAAMAAFVLTSVGGIGTAQAADRMVFAECFGRTT